MSLIEICFSADANYAPYMGVAIYSVLKNASECDEFNFYILDGGISERIKGEIASLKALKPFEIRYLTIDKKRFENLHLNPGYISLTTFYRFLIPELLPETEKIIYLDCDLIVLGSLGCLFDLDMTGWACAGVTDIMPYKYIKNTFRGAIAKDAYINAGVLLINMAYWREHKSVKELFNFVITEKPAFNDQDAINYVFRNKIKNIPYQFNVMTGHFEKFGREILKNKIVIRHFTAVDKPWKKDAFQPMTELFREYMSATPWRGYCPARSGGFLYWVCRFLRYWRLHPAFFLKPKFYRHCFNMGFKAAVR